MHFVNIWHYSVTQLKFSLFPWGKAAGAWSWPFTFIQCQGQEYVELYLNSQYVFIARCLVKHRDKFTFTCFQKLRRPGYSTKQFCQFNLWTCKAVSDFEGKT